LTFQANLISFWNFTQGLPTDGDIGLASRLLDSAKGAEVLPILQRIVTAKKNER
jgi:hypothetical protein